MTVGTVSAASMGGIVFSMLVSLGLPVGLAVYLKVKKRAHLLPLFVGAAVFLVFALILEQFCHAAVFAAAGTFLNTHLLIYAMYGGLAAALFEECGRFLAMKLLLRKKQDRRVHEAEERNQNSAMAPADALMYGVGHGGFEMIVLVGLTSISNLLGAVSINSGTLMASIGSAENGQDIITALSPLWTTPSWQFYIAGFERILAMALQVSFSVLVYRAVRDRKPRYVLIAVSLHFFVDAVTVFLAAKASILLVEAVVAVLTAGTVWYALRVYRSYPA